MSTDSAGTEKPFGLQQRHALTTSRVVGYPGPLPPFRVTRIYPKLKFKQPLHIIKEPTSDRLFVVQRYGKIFEITHDRTIKSPRLFLDMGRVAYSLCFHPRYAQNGYIYVFSNGMIEGKNRNRISRHTVSRKPPGRIVPHSEKMIIQWESKGHDGHFLSFGPDGMLWISAGDGTSGMDPKRDGQDVSNLRGTMIRIDVDRPARGKAYSVPADNPFVNRKNTRPEIWAFGFRNPYRFAFDPKNGKLWVADIGQDVWEMLYLVERGGNYGWSIMEGPEPLNSNRRKGPGPLIPPVIAHPHSEMRSITGGFFYRGKKFPELRGAFLYGDYDTRRLWAMRYDYARKKVIWKKEIARTKYRIISLGEDRNREPLIVAFGGELLELERTPKTVQPKFPFPRKLSQSGLFASVRDHRMMPAVIPYSVNSPLWSDGALKERFFAVPGLQHVQFQKNRAWGFPTGTVLIKTFSFETEVGNPKSRRRVETRFLTLHENGEWAGYSYRWNAAQTDATLVDAAGLNADYTIRDPQAAGGVRKKTWRFPSRAECMVCHTREARYVLGLTTLQMNRDHNYGPIVDNQLRTLKHIGLFKTNQPKSPFADPADLPRLPDPDDTTKPLDARARSYLHANCWHCHVVNGGGNAQMELHFSYSMDKAKIYDEKPRHIDFGIADARLIAPGSTEKSLILNRIARRGKHQNVAVDLHERVREVAALLGRTLNKNISIELD
ncbi:MAG: PQQ-dependent sugar dehydrogenase, partial [Planctomycetes bacterium]|nr:PQQ-dependent sugar dehydrogenase [Planctomycetota bacterium]